MEPTSITLQEMNSQKSRLEYVLKREIYFQVKTGLRVTIVHLGFSIDENSDKHLDDVVITAEL